MPVSLVTAAVRAGIDAHRDYHAPDGPSALARSLRLPQKSGLYGVVYDMVTLAERGVERLKEDDSQVSQGSDRNGTSSCSNNKNKHRSKGTGRNNSIWGGGSGAGGTCSTNHLHGSSSSSSSSCRSRNRAPSLSTLSTSSVSRTSSAQSSPISPGSSSYSSSSTSPASHRLSAIWPSTSHSNSSSNSNSHSPTRLSGMPPPPGSCAYTYHHLPTQVYLDVPLLPEPAPFPGRSPPRSSSGHGLSAERERMQRRSPDENSVRRDENSSRRDYPTSSTMSGSTGASSSSRTRTRRTRTRIDRLRERLHHSERDTDTASIRTAAPAYEDDRGIIVAVPTAVELYEDQIDPPPPYPGPPLAGAAAEREVAAVRAVTATAASGPSVSASGSPGSRAANGSSRGSRAGR